MTWPPDVAEFLYADADESLGVRGGLVVQNASEFPGLMWRCAECGEEVRETRGIEIGPPVTYVIDAVCPNGHPQSAED